MAVKKKSKAVARKTAKKASKKAGKKVAKRNAKKTAKKGAKKAVAKRATKKVAPKRTPTKKAPAKPRSFAASTPAPSLPPREAATPSPSFPSYNDSASFPPPPPPLSAPLAGTATWGGTSLTRSEEGADDEIDAHAETIGKGDDDDDFPS